MMASLRADHLEDTRRFTATALAMNGTPEQIRRFMDAVPGEGPAIRPEDDTTTEALAAFGLIEVAHG